MKRLPFLMLASMSLAGCFADYYGPPVNATGSVAVSASIPVGMPPPVTVSVAPPAPRYEAPMSCGPGEAYIPGGWDWDSNWHWQHGYCTPAQGGYTYMPPVYQNGTYIRGHWGTGRYGGGGGYRPPPAPAYPEGGGGGGGGYVPPPAPAYGGGGGGGTYIAPQPQPNYVPPPPPAPATRSYPPPQPPPPQDNGGYVPPPPPAPAIR